MPGDKAIRLERLLELLDLVDIGMLWVNSEGIITEINQPALEFCQRTRQEVMGQGLERLENSREALELTVLIRGGLSAGQTCSNFRIANTSKEEMRPGFAVSTYLPISGGCLAVMQPTHHLEDLERAVVQAERLAVLGQFAAGVAHEVRNPLTAVRGFVQLMEEQITSQQQRNYLKIILQELDRATGILTEYLRWARPGQSRRRPCLLDHILQDILVLVEGQARLRGVDIIRDFQLPLPLLYLDEEQIKQVFLNVIHNSLEAMANGGQLVITVWEEVDDGQVLLKVLDTGSGMDAETMKNIFKPFYTTKESGTGLGLAICQQIIYNHGGHLEISSEPGIGTVTIVHFPVMGGGCN